MVAQYGGTSNKVGNGFGVFFLYLFVTFYGGCMDVSTYVYCSEIFPTGIRAQGVGFSVSGLFLTALIYTQSAPTAFKNIGWKYYLVFIFVPLLSVLVLLKYLPETKGLTLEEVCSQSSPFHFYFSFSKIFSRPPSRMQADHRSIDPDFGHFRRRCGSRYQSHERGRSSRAGQEARERGERE